MKYFLTGFIILFLFTFSFANNPDIIRVDNLKDDVPNFAGYDEQQIVIKLDRNLLNRINKSDAANQARSGIDALDQLNRRFSARQMIQKYPDLESRMYNGRIVDPQGWFRITFNRPIDPETVAREYRLLRGVVDAQPVGIHKVYARIPNDPSLSSQWHLNQANDADIDAPEAFDLETGTPEIIVAILDTGVRYYHKDLGGINASPSNVGAARGNIWNNTAELNGASGVDDDGNGYVDDWVGWDFVTGKTGFSGEDVSTPDNDPRDFNGHGTHCSGIVAAINNNGFGVASVAGGWNNGGQSVDGNGVKIMPLRIGWSARLFIFEVGYVDMGFAADAFYYASQNGARVASCSWGSSNSGGLGDAIDYFLAGGGLIFKAAGNDNNENSDYMTARSDIISVAATNSNDVKADFSSYGTWVDISAPGDNIYSTYHDHNNANSDVYASLSGTSMATPLSAGVAALIWSNHPDWNADQVKQQLFNTADNIYGISGNSAYAGKLGAGRVNAFNAVNDGSGPPPPVANFMAEPTSGCAPLLVGFTDASSGEINSYTWDFGDGGSSTAQNPSHSYANPGTYSVSLTVTGPAGSDSETKANLITVSSPVTADFSASPTSGEAALTVNFTDQSAGSPTSWNWNFGDGGSATAQNPVHVYSNPGTFTVVLTASNSCSSDSETKVNLITVTEPAGNAPVAQFTGSPTTGNAPLSVAFADQSTNSPTGWNWNFGDGGSSTAQNPAYIYNTPGTYTVSLTATNAFGSDMETKTDYIVVNEVSQQDAMHVGSITVNMQSLRFRARGIAEVGIIDANGAAVADAVVSGNWEGSTGGTAQGTTNSGGIVTFYSNWVRGGNAFTFCVNNVSKSGWIYDAAANVMSCGSSDGSASLNTADISALKASKEIVFAENVPNPFNPTTTIRFYVPESAHLRVDIFNALGQRVRNLYDGEVAEGFNSLVWNADDQKGNKVSSGFYFYQIIYNNKQSLKRKIMLMK